MYAIRSYYDNKLEKIQHHNINISGHSIELWHDDIINQIYIFRNSERIISKDLTLTDLNGDSYIDVLFISVKKVV